MVAVASRPLTTYQPQSTPQSPTFTPAVLTPNALTVLANRYLLPGETPDLLFRRVANHISQCEKLDEDQELWFHRFYELMASLEFLPNSPTLFNAGAPHGGCLSACFTVPVEDSMEGICEARRQAAFIVKNGGGVGFDFSRLRPRGTDIRSTHRGACGPVAVMRDFDMMGTTFTQGAGAKRRAAMMFSLRIDHPDVREFIHCKDSGATIANANISVMVTDAFLSSLRGQGPHAQVNDSSCTYWSSEGRCYCFLLQHDDKKFESVDARELFREITESAHKTGDPGLILLDRINENNPLPQRIEAVNPCGEQSLEPYGSCNLGSINLSKFIAASGYGVDWGRLRQTVKTAVRFLDNVVEMNEMPTDETQDASFQSRRIGLGVMGWADLLFALGIPYGSFSAVTLAGDVMHFVQTEADAASLALGEERGLFPAWTTGPQYRNSFRTTVAPTGSISLIAGASSGIEPYFDLEWSRRMEDGTILLEGAPAFQEWKSRPGYDPTAPLPLFFQTAKDIFPTWHIKHQAAFQRFVDNGISKTINMPHEATVADVAAAYQLAILSGCKGVTIYRDGSRSVQVLTSEKPEDTSVPTDNLELRQAMFNSRLSKVELMRLVSEALSETIEACPACSSESVAYEEGCRKCYSCSWSAC